MFILFSHIMCSLKCHQDTKSDGFLIETRWGFFAFIRKQDKLSVKLMVMDPYTVDALCSPSPHLSTYKKRNSHQNYCHGTSFFIIAWRVCSRKWCWGCRVRDQDMQNHLFCRKWAGILQLGPPKQLFGLFCHEMGEIIREIIHGEVTFKKLCLLRHYLCYVSLHLCSFSPVSEFDLDFHPPILTKLTKPVFIN